MASFFFIQGIDVILRPVITPPHALSVLALSGSPLSVLLPTAVGLPLLNAAILR